MMLVFTRFFILFRAIFCINNTFLYILQFLGFTIYFALVYLNMYLKIYGHLKLGLCSILGGLDCIGVYCAAYRWWPTDPASIRCMSVKYCKNTGKPS